jgi:hypothetical protein
VARLLVTASSLGSNLDNPQKSEMGDISNGRFGQPVANRRLKENFIYNRKQIYVVFPKLVFILEQ